MIKADGLRGVAFHEAGHAVVALALQLKVAQVEIFGTDSGKTHVERSGHLPLVDRLAIAIAGMDANDMFKAPMSITATNGDRRRVLELVLDMPKAESDALREEGHQRAWDLLKANAQSVHDIAGRLLAERKIDLTGYVLKSG
jgi:ATP-dependent Zn protease